MRIAIAVAVVCAAGAAVADRATDAKRLFDEGRALYDQKKFLEACVLFEKSFELDPAPGTKLNLAECAERDAKPRKAWLLWIEAAGEFDRMGDARAKYAHGRADALAPKLATVVVRIAKHTRAQLAVKIGDRTVPAAAEIVERLEPGQVAVAVTAPGRVPFSSTVTAERGKEVAVEVAALAHAGGGPDPDEPLGVVERPVRAPAPSRSGWRTTTFVAGGATVVGFGIYVRSLLRLNKTDDGKKCIELEGGGFSGPPECATGERDRTIGTIGGVVGLLAAGVTGYAVYRWKLAPHREVAVAPIATPTTAGAVLQLRW